MQKELVKNGSITEAEQQTLLNQEWTRTEPLPEPSTQTTAGPAEAEEPVDPRKPGRVGLQPATPLAKQIVELFGPRGAKVLYYEEGKRLTIELPLDLANDLEKLFKLVGQEQQKPANPGPKTPAENSYAVDLKPATPLVKSLVELFGPRGAKVLEFEAGKRLKVEAPGDVFLDLEKMLRLVSNESQKQAELSRTLGLAQPGSAEQAKAVSSAKRLVEQLQAQESAAAAEAATIRQLQANGQAEPNQPPMAEHQRKLKNLLSTAFDLKLQWEELQVHELQSRLSRLERQIGQRKELREKIIARRGAELIEGAVLKWNPDGSSPNQTADSRANGDKSGGADVVRSSSTDQSYQEFAKKLGTMNSSVAEAEEALSRAERDAGSDLVIDTVPRARRRFEEAIRNKKAIQYEYAAVLRDLELQIESAQAEVDAAKKIADYDQQLVEQRVSPLRKLEDAQLRLKQAALTLERLKVRYELYKKAGEGLKEGQSKDEATSLDKPPASESHVKLDAEAGAKLVWEKLGLRLKVAELTPQPIRVPAFYRSGLLVLDVRDKSPAQTCGILKGDILVSWSIWQTPSLEKLLWILKLQETDPQPELTEDGQYWVVREAKMETGFLYIEVPTEAKPKED